MQLFGTGTGYTASSQSVERLDDRASAAATWGDRANSFTLGLITKSLGRCSQEGVWTCGKRVGGCSVENMS